MAVATVASNLGKRIWAFVRRHPILISVLLLVVVARIAVPFALRPFLETRVSDAINGHITIGDLDFWFLQGGVALEDVEVFAEPPGPNPIVKWRNLYVQIAWLELMRKSLVFREIVLGQPIVDLERLVSGRLNLLHLIATGPDSAPAEPEGSADSDTGNGWTVAVDRLAFSGGDISFEDFFVESPETLAIRINRFEVSRAALHEGAYEEPAQVDLDAMVAGAPVQLSARLRRVAAGISVDCSLTTENLPIRFVRYYLSRFGVSQAFAWTDLDGYLDLDLQYELETGVRDQLRGHVALREIAIAVPDLDRPTLEYSLAVEIDSVDLLHRRADIASVELRNAALVVDPVGSPILPGLITEAAAEEGTSDEKAASPDASEESDQADDPRDAAQLDAAQSAPWRWAVSALGVKDSHILVLRKDDVLEVGVHVSAQNVVDQGGDGALLEVALQEGDASLDVKGAFRLQPIGFAGSVRWADFSLPRLLTTVRGEPWPAFHAAETSGELHISAGMTAGAADAADSPTSAGAAGTVTTSGRVDVTGLELSADEFSAKWEALRVQIDEIQLPGVLPAAAKMESPEPITVKVDRVELRQPELQLSRTAEGIVLPSVPVGSGEPEEQTADDGAPGDTNGEQLSPASPSPSEEPSRVDVKATITAVALENGRVRIIDRTVKPFFHGELHEITLGAKNVAWPEQRVGEFELTMAGQKGGRLSITGGGDPTSLHGEVNAEELGLPPFNPYASTYSGYTIGDGALSVTSNVRVDADQYDATNHIVLHDLGIGGEKGGHLFREQFGIPLSLAVALMRDVQGNITLDVPVSGDRTGAKVDVLKIAGGALQQVILGALVSPLKLLGAVTLGDGKVEGFAINPIGFLPGRPLLVEEGEEQVKQLAALLAERPGLVVQLEGATTAADVLWFQEEDLIAEIREGEDIPEIPEGTATEEVEDAIEDYLEARADDEPAELPAAAEPVLHELLSQREVSPQRLTELAEARTTSVRTMLEEHAIRAERVEITPPSTEVGDGAPAVIIHIGTS